MTTSNTAARGPWHQVLRRYAHTVASHAHSFDAAARLGQHAAATTAILSAMSRFTEALQRDDPHQAEAIAREFHAALGPMKLANGNVRYLQDRVRLGDASWDWARQLRAPLFVALPEIDRGVLIEFIDAAQDSVRAYEAARALAQRFETGPRERAAIEEILREARSKLTRSLHQTAQGGPLTVQALESAVMSAVDLSIEEHALHGPGLRLLPKQLHS
jgi:hypothetical protein